MQNGWVCRWSRPSSCSDRELLNPELVPSLSCSGIRMSQICGLCNADSAVHIAQRTCTTRSVSALCNVHCASEQCLIRHCWEKWRGGVGRGGGRILRWHVLIADRGGGLIGVTDTQREARARVTDTSRPPPNPLLSAIGEGLTWHSYSCLIFGSGARIAFRKPFNGHLEGFMSLTMSFNVIYVNVLFA